MSRSGYIDELPLLHLDGKFIGTADIVQDHEDHGELEDILRGVDIEIIEQRTKERILETISSFSALGVHASPKDEHIIQEEEESTEAAAVVEEEEEIQVPEKEELEEEEEEEKRAPPKEEVIVKEEEEEQVLEEEVVVVEDEVSERVLEEVEEDKKLPDDHSRKSGDLNENKSTLPEEADFSTDQLDLDGINRKLCNYPGITELIAKKLQ